MQNQSMRFLKQICSEGLKWQKHRKIEKVKKKASELFDFEQILMFSIWFQRYRRL